MSKRTSWIYSGWSTYRRRRLSSWSDIRWAPQSYCGWPRARGNASRKFVLLDNSPTRIAETFLQIHAGFQSALRVYRSIAEYIERLAWTARWSIRICSGISPNSSLRPVVPGGYELKRDFAMLRGFEKWDATRSEAWTLLARIPCSALIVPGFASAVLSQRDAGRMVSALSRGQMREVSRAGHGVMLDNPDGLSDGAQRSQ